MKDILVLGTPPCTPETRWNLCCTPEPHTPGARNPYKMYLIKVWTGSLHNTKLVRNIATNILEEISNNFRLRHVNKCVSGIWKLGIYLEFTKVVHLGILFISCTFIMYPHWALNSVIIESKRKNWGL